MRFEPAVTEAPEGWAWHRRPAANAYGEFERGLLRLALVEPLRDIDLTRAYQSLYAWYNSFENKPGIAPFQHDPHRLRFTSDRSRLVYRTVDVYPDRGNITEQEWTHTICRHGTDHGPMLTTIKCECGATPERLECVHRTPTRCRGLVFLMWSNEQNGYLCHNHRRQCYVGRRQGGCAEIINSEYQYCAEHGIRQACLNCPTLVESPVGGPAQNEPVCRTCQGIRCGFCRRFDDTVEWVIEQDRDMLACKPCRDRMNEVSIEKPDQIAATAEMLRLEVNPVRPIRTCSIELETTNSKATLPAALAVAGLTPYNKIQRYGASRDIVPAFCHVEFDRSLGETGGELIFDRVHMDETEDLTKIAKALDVVQALVASKKATINTKCGLHIHIDAHRFGVPDVRNLVLVTNHLEDLIYRLSAANYEFHRGTRYAAKIDKTGYEDVRGFALRFFQGNGHANALNVAHYWGAMQRSCICGAVVAGVHTDCTCDLGKCTFEWRFFNGTANPRKIHAYAALVQSLTAFAKSAPDLNADNFPVMEYMDQPELAITEQIKVQWEDRLKWLLRNCYFGDNEKESLRYVTNNSMLSELGKERLDAVWATRYEPLVELKPQEITKQYRDKKKKKAAFAPGSIEAMMNARRVELRAQQQANIFQAVPEVQDEYYDEEDV